MNAEALRRPWPEVRREEMAQYPEVFAALEAHFASIRSGGPPHTDRPFIVIERPADMPLFANEHEEWEFWNVHSLGDAWFDLKEPIPDDWLPPVRPRSRQPARITNQS